MNYKNEVNGDVVQNFATKYLKQNGLGRLGIIVVRKVPRDVKVPVPQHPKPSSAVKAQKEQLRDYHRVIILLEGNYLIEMLNMKLRGVYPTDLLRDRVFTIKSMLYVRNFTNRISPPLSTFILGELPLFVNSHHP